MKRIYLSELHDQPWFPESLRNMITDYLQFAASRLNLYAPTAPLIQDEIKRTGATQVVDLCSAASGPWAQLVEGGWNTPIKLTDKFPSPEAAMRMFAGSKSDIEYVKEPVDATDVPAHLDGVRTIFTGFHHFELSNAQLILKNAVDQKAAIGIFEFTQRSIPTILIDFMFIWITVLLVTPFLRPLTFSRLFFTYTLILPLIITWDGLASNLRTFSPDELKELGESTDNEDYTWKSGQIKSPFRVTPITYLMGCPKVVGQSSDASPQQEPTAVPVI